MKAQEVIECFGTFIKFVRRAKWERDHNSSHPMDAMRIENSRKELVAAIESMDSHELHRFSRIITHGLFQVGKDEGNQAMMIQAAKF